jgi:phage shock protein C
MTELPHRPDDLPGAPPTKTLRRSRTNRIVAGVCGGIAEYLGMDPVLVRIVMVVLALAGGGGVVLYLLAWVLIPEEDASDGSPNVAPASTSGFERGQLVVGVVLIAIGAIFLIQILAPRFGRYFWPVAFIAVGLAIIVQAARQRS